MFNKLEAPVLSEYKRSRAAPSTFCTLIKHYFSFIKHYINIPKIDLYVDLPERCNCNLPKNFPFYLLERGSSVTGQIRDSLV
jgi:hypothetical protein